MIKPYDDKYDSNSSKTIILWENNLSRLDNMKGDSNINVPSFHQQLNRKVPRGLSENYLYFMRKIADDLVNGVIDDSELIAQCSFKAYELDPTENSDGRNDIKVTRQNYVQKCKDRLLRTSSDSIDSLLLSETGWLNRNGMFDNHAAISNISDYIKKNWDLDPKYLFSVEKADTLTTPGSNSHGYKAEFSVPTNQYPIPLITVSAFFTVEVTPLISLPVYMKYQLEMDRRVYVVGKDSFHKKRFEHLFKIKRDAYMDINKYPGWSSGPSHSRH